MKTFEITEEQINELVEDTNLNGENKLKNWFPDAFLTPRLELSKWYKSINGKLVFITDVKTNISNSYNYYGIDFNGNWIEKNWTNMPESFLLATPQEIESDLINEAKKKYEVGCFIKTVNGLTTEVLGYRMTFNIETNVLILNDGYKVYELFNNGKWAEIIQKKEYSMQEIANALNIDVNQLKIKK